MSDAARDARRPEGDEIPSPRRPTSALAIPCPVSRPRPWDVHPGQGFPGLADPEIQLMVKWGQRIALGQGYFLSQTCLHRAGAHRVDDIGDGLDRIAHVRNGKALTRQEQLQNAAIGFRTGSYTFDGWQHRRNGRVLS